MVGREEGKTVLASEVRRASVKAPSQGVDKFEKLGSRQGETNVSLVGQAKDLRYDL